MSMENYTIFFVVRKMLNNYIITWLSTGCFFSLSWCVKCQNMCTETVVVVDIFSKQLSVGLRSSITARRAELLLVHSNVFHIFCHFFRCSVQAYCVKKLLKPSFSRETCKAASFQLIHYPMAQKFTQQIWYSAVRLLFSFLFCLLLDPWTSSGFDKILCLHVVTLPAFCATLPSGGVRDCISTELFFFVDLL